MRSAETDLTAKAQIRDTALRLFARDGFDAVSVRRIATEAGVSPGLVLHHFGSKAGLRQAVDEYVIASFDDLVGQPTEEEVVAALEGEDTRGLDLFIEQMSFQPHVLDYLRRMLLTDDDAARRLVRHWHEMSVRMLGQWADRGVIDPGPDLPVRAALLLSADLGVILLRGPLTDVLGFDPLAPDGVRRWAADSYALTSLMLTEEGAALAEPTNDPETDTRKGTR